MKSTLIKAIDASKGHLEIKKILNSSPSQVFSSDKRGNSPLHKAVEQGNYELVNYLLVWRADPNVKNAMGHTSLHLAIIHKRFDIAKLLIENNAFVAPTSATGKTPLHFLTGHDEDEESLEIAKLMLQLGAFPHERDQSGTSPLDMAERLGKMLFAELLRQY